MKNLKQIQIEEDEKFDRENFTPFNKMSGSRHLDENKIKEYLYERDKAIQQAVLDEVREKIEELLKTPHYNNHQTYNTAIKEVLSILTTKE